MALDAGMRYRARKMLHGDCYKERTISHQGTDLPIMSDPVPSRIGNPFKSEKQRKYLFAKKPSVAKKFSLHSKGLKMPKVAK